MTAGTGLDLGDLGFGEGAHLLLARALAGTPPGEWLSVRGHDEALGLHLGAWCRRSGHEFRPPDGDERAVGHVRTGTAETDRWRGAERAGDAAPGRVVASAPAHWGLAARGALVEIGGPDAGFDLAERDLLWADIAPRLYAHAAGAQWDPAVISWNADFTLPPEIEAAVVQIMTYLVENEQAALVLPARFLARIHPHFREVMQLLAVQAADEARHVEVFSRRAVLHGSQLGTSSVGGRASLATLLAEPDFTLASFLLSVLGEGTFLNLLGFLDDHAPDPVTGEICRRVRQDEARHVAFGVAHLRHQSEVDSAIPGRLRAAVERRHDALAGTAGLNSDVFDALVLLAAGSWDPAAIAAGYRAVRALEDDMDAGRRRRLVHLGFPPDEAAALSALHTRNFM